MQKEELMQKKELVQRDKRMQKMNPIVTHHLVKNEDLNHHGTLYAGRIAEWFVETGFMAAASFVPSENLVCVKIHDMTFKCPVRAGETVRLAGEVVKAGKTSLLSKVTLSVKEREIMEGYATFVHVDEWGKAIPHGIQLEGE